LSTWTFQILASPLLHLKHSLSSYPLNSQRCLRLANDAIKMFSLDLKGLVVLTEAATNNFSLTPLIAALAGADRVIALGGDSRHGSYTKVRDELLNLACAWGVSDRILVTNDRSDASMSLADVVTNLGFVRPLDADFLSRLKKTAALPLMWETWEFRPQDLDIGVCRQLGIPVLGTNEDHPDLGTINYLGYVAIKLLFELQVEIFRSHIVVVGSGKFAKAIHATLLDAGTKSADLVFPSKEMAKMDCWFRADAIVFAEHQIPDLLFGAGGWLEPKRIANDNPSVSIAHICGNVDENLLRNIGLRCSPSAFAGFGYMSVTADFIGPRPVIDLHTAGLRVGELMARFRLKGLPAFEAEMRTLEQCPMAQGFEGVHLTRHIQNRRIF
jgi:hypothetical protein